VNSETSRGLAPVGERDHVIGSEQPQLTLVEYGDFGCPHCFAAKLPLESLLRRFDGLRLVWRHFPDPELHPDADLAALPKNRHSALQATPLVVGATGFEPATFRPPAECATSVRGCRGLAFPHSHAVSVALSCPEFRADWNPEWNPGRRWTAPRYFRFRVRGEARPERIRNLVSSGATREGASASLTKSVLLRAECSSDSQLSASSRDAGTRESATAGVGHLGGLENR
jgi:hypothetical protein